MYCLVCVHTHALICHGAWMEVREELSGVLCYYHVDFWEIKSCQAWQKIPLPYCIISLSTQTLFFFLTFHYCTKKYTLISFNYYLLALYISLLPEW